MLRDEHLYHDSLNNEVLLSNNRQKQVNLLSHRYPGNITCSDSYAVSNSYLCDNIIIYIIILNYYLTLLHIYLCMYIVAELCL